MTSRPVKSSPLSCRTALAAAVIGLALLALPGDAAASGTFPNDSYTPDQLGRVISPWMELEPKNQPAVVNGYLLLAGNGSHHLYDISDPTRPRQVSSFLSPFRFGEAESHQLAIQRSADGRWRAATTSGHGIDLWDLTDAEAPELLAAVELEGIDYGDNTNAVWGIDWQGEFIFVGGTNTGLHVVDASDPREPLVVARVPTSELGGISVGPLWAIGNLLIVTTPKEHIGIATVDISDPRAPTLLDFTDPGPKSYIGGFYGGYAYHLMPLRTFDVTTDPTNIQLIGSVETEMSEYMTFGDGFLFLGMMRPNGGVSKIDISDPNEAPLVTRVHGRRDDFLNGVFTDDQFSLPIGNLIVLADDEVNIGGAIAVHDTARDTTPPEVMYVNPPDGATNAPLTTRVGISFSDQIDLRSVNIDTVIVRPLGGEPLRGSWGNMQTVVNFWPATPLEPNTTYELIVVAGGVTDLVGNATPREFRATWSTGEGLVALPCSIEAGPPTVVGGPVTLSAADAGDGAVYTWALGEESTETTSAPAVTHRFESAGRHRVRLTVEVGDARRSCGALHIAHRPLLPDRPSMSASIALDEVGGVAWVVNPHAGSVTAIDTDTLEVRSESPVCDDPRSVAVAAGGEVWVACRGSDDVVVLDRDGVSVETIELGWGTSPFGVVIAPDGRTAWVTLEQRGAVAAIDVESRALLDVVEFSSDDTDRARGVVPRVRGVAISGDGERVFVSRFISSDLGGEVFVVDASARDHARTIVLPYDLGPDTSAAGRGLPNYLGALAISPNGTDAWIPAKKDNIERGLRRDGLPLTTTNTVRTMVARIDLVEELESGLDRVDLDDQNLASAIVFSPNGDLVFVATLGSNQVDVIDAIDLTRVAGMATGLAPDGLAISDDGRLYTQNLTERTVSVYDVTGLLAGTDGAAHRLLDISTVSEEPMENNVLLGLQIFYNADSRQMSQDGYISCATCHLDGADDGRTWDFSDRGEGYRNTTDLRGRAGVAHGMLHWSGNFDEVQDFEHDLRGHFGGSGLLRDEDFFADGRDEPLGEPKAGLSERLDALAAYVTSLDTFPRSPFREADGQMTALAEQGRAIFLSLDCVDCHSGQTLTDSPEARLYDVGTLRETSGERLGSELPGLDTPTLRGLWTAPPFFHDGSAPTLHDTLLAAGHGNAQGLDPDELDALVAFLLQIENEDLDLTRTPVEADAGETTADVGDAGFGDVGVGDVGSDADAETDVEPGDATGDRGKRRGCATVDGRQPPETPTSLLLLAFAVVACVRNQRRRVASQTGTIA